MGLGRAQCFFANMTSIAVSYCSQYFPAWASGALGTSPQMSSLTLTLMALGSTIGLIFGGHLHDSLGDRGRFIAVLMYSFVSSALAISLPVAYILDGWYPGVFFANPASFVYFIYAVSPAMGASSCVLNYVVITVYMAEKGGKTHASTAATFADIFGIAASAITQLVIGHLIDRARWLEVLVVTAALVCWTALFFVLFACSMRYGKPSTARDAKPAAAGAAASDRVSLSGFT